MQDTISYIFCFYSAHTFSIPLARSQGRAQHEISNIKNMSTKEKRKSFAKNEEEARKYF
jgi:hypothetical protein